MTSKMNSNSERWRKQSISRWMLIQERIYHLVVLVDVDESLLRSSIDHRGAGWSLAVVVINDSECLGQ